jgi:hypothetical protein
MKSLLLLLLLVMISCKDPKPEPDYSDYQISYEDIIPEQDKEKATQLMEKLVSAASLHMTAGDYEDPEDLIEQAQSTTEDMYAERVVGLWHNYKFIPESEFTPQEKVIFDYLSSHK